VLPAPVLTPPLVAAHHQQGAKRASTVFDAIIALERGVAVRGHPYVLMLRSPSGSRSAENLSGRGQSFAVATDIRRSGSTTFGRKPSPRVRNSNSRINTPPFAAIARKTVLSARVAQLVRAAEPVHPMCSVANNQFLN